jgi:hypothetical protein
MNRILALDLGSRTGWATWTRAGLETDSLLLVPAKEMDVARGLRLDRRADPRVLAFSKWLSNLHAFDIVVFEDVQFQTSTAQCQLWASFRAAVWIQLAHLTQHLDCVPVGTLKRFASGNGAATKEVMAKCLCRRLPERFEVPRDRRNRHEIIFDTVAQKNLYDDAVDAVFLVLWAQANIRI